MARASLTIQFPAELLDEAKRLLVSGETLNDLIIGAIEREVHRRREIEDLLAETAQTREEIKREHGVHPDSTPLIRALREGRERWD